MNNLRFLAFVAIILAIFSCKKDSPIPIDRDYKMGLFKSNTMFLGRGQIYAWIQTDQNSNPTSIGFTLTKGALEGLQQSQTTTHDAANHYGLTLPKQFNQTPFQSAGVNWNPKGHGPPYVESHFDFHFYTMTSADVQAIPAYTPGLTPKFDKLPPYAYFPPNYITPADTNRNGPIAGTGTLGATSEPFMGYHWVEITSPEFSPGGKFTQTFVYGSYNGMVNFIEPMMTVEFLRKTTYFTRPIPQPSKVQVTGYYPTRLVIQRHFGDYQIVMDQMVYRIAS